MSNALMVSMVGVEIPLFELEATKFQFEALKSLDFTVKEIEALARVKRYDKRVFSVRTLESYHVLVEKYRQIEAFKKAEKAKEVEVKKNEFVLPTILKVINWTQAEKPENQEMFELCANNLVRELISDKTGSRFQLEKKFWENNKDLTRRFLGRMKRKAVEAGFKVKGLENGNSWLIIYFK
jgi:hypothetical protein